ncbi:MAG: Inosose dehydratase [uncultured Rubrobacteraceae bacterium]|uniref:Inosose dehydratase n=1 Tax=uncultured Rubrobacteraceae bacterium TaxID=349277 RepID=A0A6J4QK90_9ACTN|nr:MAG: Inosose dehydratase [uncultured Rubrobacteraceae bacterium]
MNQEARIAGAPISWGVNEVPGWGYQMGARRVLEEAASLGLPAIESGPEGFLPEYPAEASRVLGRHGLRLVGGFVPVVLHHADAREEGLASVERQAGFFAAAGADVLILAADTEGDGYEETVELDAVAWDELFEGLSLAEEIGARHGLTVAVHPHFGTAIERPHHVRRFLEGCETGLCLDTGHLVVGGDDPVKVAELAAGRVSIVHLKDVDRLLADLVAAGKIGFEDAVRQGVFKALGDGDVETGRVIGLLEESGYEGWYVLEQDVMLDDEPEDGEGPIEDVRKSLEFVRSVLDGEGEDKA